MKPVSFAAIVVGSILPCLTGQAQDYRVETIVGGSHTAQSDDGRPAVAAALADLFWLHRGPDGTLYFEEVSQNNVRAFQVGGMIRRVAGNGKTGRPPLTPGPASEVALGPIQGGAVDPIAPIAFLNTLGTQLITGVNLKTGLAFPAAGGGPRGGPESGPADQIAVAGIGSFCIAQGSNSPTGQKGVLFFIDVRLQKIRRLIYDFDAATGGIKNTSVDTVAGEGGIGFTAEGPALAAKMRFGLTSGMAYASSLNKLIFAQSFHNVIMSVDFPSGPAGASGNVAVIGGFFGSSPSSFNAGEGGPATAAAISPNGIAFDPKTLNIYFTSAPLNCVRMFRIGGNITTVAGNGLATDSGLGGPATRASVPSPRGIAFDPDTDSVYIAATGTRRVLRLRNGVVDSVAGVGPKGGLITKPTPGHLAALEAMADGTMADDGTIYAIDRQHSVINRFDPKSRLVSLFAGTGITALDRSDGTPARAVSLNRPRSVATDSKGNVYVVETGAEAIRRIDRRGTIHLYAGRPGVVAFEGDGGPATAAKLANPDSAFYSSATRALYFHEDGRFRRVDQNGIISTIAGDGSSNGDSPDGTPATEAKLGGASGGTHIWVDGSTKPETIYFTETAAGKVRKFAIGGAIFTVAGANGAASNRDGIPGATGLLRAPTGIVGDGKGNLYIAERGNRRISRIDGKGNIHPFTVTSGTPLSDPQTLVMDSAGRLIVFDSGANQVFRLNPL